MGGDQERPAGQESDPGRTAHDNRRFVEAVTWVARNGARWRALPREYGRWNSTHRRFRRWLRLGAWQMLFNTQAASADTEWLIIDSTIVRAHQQALALRFLPRCLPP